MNDGRVQRVVVEDRRQQEPAELRLPAHALLRLGADAGEQPVALVDADHVVAEPVVAEAMGRMDLNMRHGEPLKYTRRDFNTGRVRRHGPR